MNDIWDFSLCVAIIFFVIAGIVDWVYRYLKRRERALAAEAPVASTALTAAVSPLTAAPERVCPVVKHDTTTNTNINMKNSFVAIDFEHLHPSHETACEVGAVRVVDGLVTGRLHSTINPPEEMCTGRDNSDIIGLTADMLAHSPRFPEVYAMLTAFVGDLPLVAHNASTERSVLAKCCRYYDIEETLLRNGLTDTCALFGGKGLAECCAEHGITLSEHHDPLHDAEATARLYLLSVGETITPVIRKERLSTKSLHKFKEEKASFDPSILQPLSDDEVVNKDTPFFGGVKTVVTGQYIAYPDRNLLKQRIKELGADIDTSVSSRTRILVTGTTGVGPAKLQKAKEYGARIITEEELYQWIEKQC